MTDPDLQALLDREEIRDLVNRYCDNVIQRDIAGIVDLFAGDGEFASPGTRFDEDGHSHPDPDSMQRFKGPDELMSLYSSALPAQEPIPSCHNHVVELTGPKRAWGRCLSEIRRANDPDFFGYALYEDEYVKTGSGWKFQVRKVNLNLDPG